MCIPAPELLNCLMRRVQPTLAVAMTGGCVFRSCVRMHGSEDTLEEKNGGETYRQTNSHALSSSM